jgi:hypothetical protein
VTEGEEREAEVAEARADTGTTDAGTTEAGTADTGTAEAGTAPPLRVSTLELFFDLVFVFTITQLTGCLRAT